MSARPYKFFVLKVGTNRARWKQTARFVVDLGPEQGRLIVRRLREHGDEYPRVAYFSEAEFKRLFKAASS